MKTKKAFISIALVIGLLGSSGAPAAVIAFEAVNDGPNGPIGTLVTYDAASHIFTVNTPYGFPTDPATFLSPVFLSDIVGTFSMTADIDNAGVLHSGVYIWSGKIPAFGIFASTTLMAGRLLSETLSPPVGPELTFAATADIFNPLLRAVVGPIGSASIQFVAIPIFGFGQGGGAPWTANLGGFTDVEAPDILGFAPAAIPEPSTVALALLGLAALGWNAVRRRLFISQRRAIADKPQKQVMTLAAILESIPNLLTKSGALDYRTLM